MQALTSCINEQWPHSFATVQDRVPHRVMQTLWTGRRWRQRGMQAVIDSGGVRSDPIFEVFWQSVSTRFRAV